MHLDFGIGPFFSEAECPAKHTSPEVADAISFKSVLCSVAGHV